MYFDALNTPNNPAGQTLFSPFTDGPVEVQQS